jgi:hypothetical protein
VRQDGKPEEMAQICTTGRWVQVFAPFVTAGAPPALSPG